MSVELLRAFSSAWGGFVRTVKANPQLRFDYFRQNHDFFRFGKRLWISFSVPHAYQDSIGLRVAETNPLLLQRRHRQVLGIHNRCWLHLSERVPWLHGTACYYSADWSLLHNSGPGSRNVYGRSASRTGWNWKNRFDYSWLTAWSVRVKCWGAFVNLL